MPNHYHLVMETLEANLSQRGTWIPLRALHPGCGSDSGQGTSPVRVD
jgi:hypothetical protein